MEAMLKKKAEEEAKKQIEAEAKKKLKKAFKNPYESDGSATPADSAASEIDSDPDWDSDAEEPISFRADAPTARNVLGAGLVAAAVCMVVPPFSMFGTAGAVAGFFMARCVACRFIIIIYPCFS